jgi:autotransporter-associated beta strand protein
MGVLTLLGSNTYSGGTTISGGTLQVGNGGAFGSIVGNVTNNAALVFNRSDSYTCGCNIGGTGQLIQAGPGTLTLAGAISSPVFANAGRIMVGPTGMLSSDLTIAVGARVENNASALQVLNFTNSGTFLGSADLSGNFVNQSSGDVRIAGGQRVYIQGTSLQSNSGLVEVLGTPSAPAQFESVGPLTNSGMIAAQNADVYFDGGVTNQGSMAFTYGIGNVFGNVTNSGGTVAIAGSAGVTFYGNVVQDGTLNVGAGSSVVFLGAFSGNGGITTDGPIYFMGNLRPGNSPAAVTIEGSAFIGGSLELSGNVSGDGASLALSAGQQLVLSGSNTYTGGTSVNNGVLVAENASAIPSGSLLAIDGSGSVVLGNPAYAEPLGLLGGSAGPLDLRASGASDPQAGAPVHAVPEPGTTSLLAAGLACGAAIGLKRRVVRTDGKSPFAASR